MKWILSFQSQKDTQEYATFCSVLNKLHVNCICVFNDEHKPWFGSKYCTKIAHENESYRSCTWRHTLLSNMYMYKLSSLSYVIFPVFGHSVIIIFILYCWAWKWCSVVYPPSPAWDGLNRIPFILHVRINFTSVFLLTLICFISDVSQPSHDKRTPPDSDISIL